jgi:predicted NAD-dependent protein-ADP-ribosyltransferase YbiA (DUF1768 family)
VQAQNLVGLWRALGGDGGDGAGRNRLGELLMELRGELIGEFGEV